MPSSVPSIVLAASALCQVSAHGVLNKPLPRNNHKRVSLKTAAAAGDCSNTGGAKYWFSNGCWNGCTKCYPDSLPDHADRPPTDHPGPPADCPNHVEPTLNETFRTINIKQAIIKDDFTKYHPWRSPGIAPTMHPCSAHKLITSGGWRDFNKKQGKPMAHWKAGKLASVGVSIAANHGGGYQYRLCPSDFALESSCFEAMVLPFAHTHSELMHWEGGKTGDFKNYTIQAVDVRTGVFPPHSTWRRNPIPDRHDPQFPNPIDGNGKTIAWAVGHLIGGKGSLHRNFQIKDYLQVPLVAGTWLLQWRWDSEQTAQVWQHCADIVIEPSQYNMHSIQLAWDTWKCLDLPHGITKNGRKVGIWDCNNAESQMWIYDGQFVKYKKDPTKCLDVAGYNAENGGSVWLWDCTGDDNQKFGYDDDANRLYSYLQNSNGQNPCLDMSDRMNGNHLWLWECNGYSQQMWIKPSASSIQSGGVCVDVPLSDKGDAFVGTRLWLWECGQHSNQAWVWTNFNIRFGPDLSLCLDLPGGNDQNGQELWIWQCDGSDNQKWGYNPDTGAIYWAGDIMLCVDGQALTSGNKLWMWECNGYPQQQWVVNTLLGTNLTQHAWQLEESWDEEGDWDEDEEDPELESDEVLEEEFYEEHVLPCLAEMGDDDPELPMSESELM